MALYKSQTPWMKWIITIWAFFECLFFAGTLYGWSSLVFVFKDEGIYADLCQDQSQTGLLGKPVTNVTVTVFQYNVSYDKSNSRLKNDIEMTTVRGNRTDTLPSNNKTVAYTANDTVSTEHAQCKKQDSMFSLCFTISSSIFCISCVVMGHVNYKIGTRNTRYISYAIFVAGALCLSFTSKSLPWLMFPGLSLIGIGGLPIFVTNNQVAYLFTKGSSSVVGLLCGGYDMSAAVYLVIKLAHQGGFTRKHVFFVLTGVHIMTLVSTQKFLPKDFIQQIPMRKPIEKIVKKPDPSASDALLMNDSIQAARRPSIADTQSLTSYLRQPLFITHNVWLCILQLRFYYYIGNLNTYLSRVLNDDKTKVSYFTDVCFYTMMGGLFTSFLVGVVYDGQKAIFKGGTTQLYRCLMPALLPLSLASIFALTLSGLVLVQSEASLYVSFIIMTLYRSFTYAMAAAFINAIFPARYFAVLYGITMIAAGIFSLFQYALFSWSEAYAHAPFQVDVFLLCMTAVSLAHPVYMWYCAWLEEKSSRTELWKIQSWFLINQF